MKKILLVVLILLIVIQFIRPARNVTEGKQTGDITMVYNVPHDVQVILDKACRDCHSDYTNYPWYDNIQPVAWWMNRHIKEGKEELNLSQFGNYTAKKNAHKLEEIAELVDQNEMPLGSYTWMHKGAKLTAEEKKILITWSKTLRQQIIMQEHVQ